MKENTNNVSNDEYMDKIWSIYIEMGVKTRVSDLEMKIYLINECKSEIFTVISNRKLPHEMLNFLLILQCQDDYTNSHLIVHMR